MNKTNGQMNGESKSRLPTDWYAPAAVTNSEMFQSIERVVGNAMSARDMWMRRFAAREDAAWARLSPYPELMAKAAKENA